MRVVIFGGSGFIGRRLAATLAEASHQQVLPVRNRERAKDNLILLPNADVFTYNPIAVADMQKAMQGADAVVNLVGVLNETKRHLFELVHGEFVRRLVEACVAQRVPHIVHVGAIGTATGAPSAYLRSKAKAEQLIRAENAVRHTIVRSSVVFGENAPFINQFATLLRYFPILPLPGAAGVMQPIAVSDLAAFLLRVLEDDSSANRILHVGGPQEFTLHQIVASIATTMGRRRRLIPLGGNMSYVFAAMAELVPFVNLVTRDNMLSLRVPSVCAKNGNDAARVLGTLTELEPWLANYFSSNSSLDILRLSAGR